MQNNRITPRELKQKVDIAWLVNRDEPLKQISQHVWQGVNHDSLRVNTKMGMWSWWSGKYTNELYGDHFQWLLERHGMNFHAAFNEIARLANVDIYDPMVPSRSGIVVAPEPPPPPQDLPKISGEIVEKCIDNLMTSPRGIDYIENVRKIPINQAIGFSLGWMDNLTNVGPCVIIPVLDGDGNILTIRYRAVDAQEKMLTYGYMFKGYGAQIYMGNMLDHAADEIYVVEGEFKCMHMTMAGFETVGIMGVNAVKNSWLTRFSTKRRVYLCLDPDQNAHNISWANALATDHPDVRVVSLPDKPDDMILSGNAQAIRDAAKWGSKLNAKTPEELRELRKQNGQAENPRFGQGLHANNHQITNTNHVKQENNIGSPKGTGEAHQVGESAGVGRGGPSMDSAATKQKAPVGRGKAF